MCKSGNLPPSCAVVTKFWNLNFLEPARPVQACNGSALLLQNVNAYENELQFQAKLHYVE